MERKTKHRILGILVVIGLVIILLPLFQSGKEPASEPMLVKAPPFPEQSTQVASADNQVANQQPIPVQSSSSDSGVNQQPDDTIRVVHPSIINAQSSETVKPSKNAADPLMTADNAAKSASAKTPTETDKNVNVESQSVNNVANQNQVVKSQNADDVTKMDDEDSDTTSPIPSSQLVKNDTSDQPITPKLKEVASKSNVVPIATPKLAIAKAKKPVHVAAKHVRTAAATAAAPAKLKSMNFMHEPINNDGLFSLKNAVWVIQIGSFKNKSNALRLVNQLRASGYRAFIQQVASNTRVFVGPETKQTSARALASQLESDMHIRGIVISYKPLTL